MKAIPTIYSGVLFRSRMEARWAVAFDHLGLTWEYEPEGFNLKSGARYLPDFRLSFANKILWLEIKPPNEKSEKMEEFAKEITGNELATTFRQVPHLDRGFDGWEIFMNYGDGVGYDHSYFFCVCAGCNTVGFEFCGKSDRIGCGCIGCNSHENPRDPRIIKAFSTARSHRFGT